MNEIDFQAVITAVSNNFMARFTVNQSVEKHLSDTLTPVSAYLRLRKFFPNSALLESSDYRAAENSFSYICCDPLAEVRMEQDSIFESFPDGTSRKTVLGNEVPREKIVETALSRFICEFSANSGCRERVSLVNGLFGYLSYQAVAGMECISFSGPSCPAEEIPSMHYVLYRYVLAFDHFHNRLFIIENQVSPSAPRKSFNIANLAMRTDFQADPFRPEGEVRSNMDDSAHAAMVEALKAHIRRGDVFQIVGSRKFERGFKGDDFNVYRALRSINPSPYLFYFDCGDFHLFGSSPECQLQVKGGRASLFPIAGTYRRTGEDARDIEAAGRLINDPKESAEHVMLVDLARNDLSVHCYPVSVEKFKEIQLYSHVIHLVSQVSGRLQPDVSPLSVLTSTFPAGTLSGAPKHRAMQLLDRYEPSRRTFYGGAIGYIGFDGEINHAITIRSFLSRAGKLMYQAGSGIVAGSVAQTEVDEVKNKLAALSAAIDMAGSL